MRYQVCRADQGKTWEASAWRGAHGAFNPPRKPSRACVPTHVLSLPPHLPHLSLRRAMFEVRPLPHSAHTSTFPCGHSAAPGSFCRPGPDLERLPLPRSSTSALPQGWAPAASPGLGGWYPAQLTRGLLSWYRAQKEGLSLKRQHQFCGSSSSSVGKSSGWGEMRDLQDPAGRFGQDDVGGKGMVGKSGPHEFRSHPA